MVHILILSGSPIHVFIAVQYNIIQYNYYSLSNMKNINWHKTRTRTRTPNENTLRWEVAGIHAHVRFNARCPRCAVPAKSCSRAAFNMPWLVSSIPSLNFSRSQNSQLPCTCGGGGGGGGVGGGKPPRPMASARPFASATCLESCMFKIIKNKLQCAVKITPVYNRQ